MPRFSEEITEIHEVELIVSLDSVPLTRVTKTFSTLHVVDPQKKHLQWRGGMAVPAERVPGYSYIFRDRSGSGYVAMSKRDRSGNYSTDFPSAERDLLTINETPRHRVPSARGRRTSRTLAKMIKVPRTVDLFVIDRVRHEEDLRRRMADALAYLDLEQLDRS